MSPEERCLFYPHGEHAYLDWFEAKFSAVFIALHPFFRISGIDPAGCDWDTIIIDNRSDAIRNENDTAGSGDLLKAGELADSERTGKVSREELSILIRHRAESISWQTICEQAGFASLGDLNRALLTHIKALNKTYRDTSGCERLREFCEKNQIFMPNEGQFQVLHEAPLGQVFASNGATHFFVMDETGPATGNNIYEHELTDFADLRFWHEGRTRFTQDRSTAAIVDWDSFFTLICISNDRLKDLDISGKFEGFWARHDTNAHWWLPEASSLVQN